MAHDAYEVYWKVSLLWDLDVSTSTHVAMYCNNKDATFITSNAVFHERTKHINIDCHYIRRACWKNSYSSHLYI